MPTRSTLVGARSKMKTRTALDFTAVTVPDQLRNPTRVVGEFSLRVVNYGGRIRFRVEQELTGTGTFTCTVSHRCNGPEHKATTFTGDTAESVLTSALDYYAEFNGAPQTLQMPSPDRFTPVPEYTLGGFDHASFNTWLLRGHLDG